MGFRNLNSSGIYKNPNITFLQLFPSLVLKFSTKGTKIKAQPSPNVAKMVMLECTVCPRRVITALLLINWAKEDSSVFSQHNARTSHLTASLSNLA